MKRFSLFFTAMVMLLGLFSCQKAGNGDSFGSGEAPVIDLTTKSAEFVQKGNDFAFRFLEKVDGSQSKDYVISPLSMQFLLGMILNGTAGATADEICRVLGYGAGETAAVNAYCQAMLEQLPNLDSKTTLAIANALVVNSGWSLNADYVSLLDKYYKAEASSLDFYDSKGSADIINKWCSDHTNGLIPSILDEVNPRILAYLLDALYFKSEWVKPFPKEGTRQKAAFTTGAGKEVTVPMMYNREHFLYNVNETLRAVRLPYGNGAFSMTVILPSEGKTLSDVIGYLDEEKWRAFTGAMEEVLVHVGLPKFETQSFLDLKDLLADMGMPTAFDGKKADFSPMSPAASHLDFVKQKAVIKVSEEGAEAAAVSIGAVETNSIGGPSERIVVFHADHPFLYLITESSTGALLFAGKFTGLGGE